jgi:hypothetical protein
MHNVLPIVHVSGLHGQVSRHARIRFALFNLIRLDVKPNRLSQANLPRHWNVGCSRRAR